MWARLSGTLVLETTDTDPAGRYHPDIVWVAAPAGTVVGGTLVGGVAQPPPAVPAPPVIRRVRPGPWLARLAKPAQLAVTTAAQSNADLRLYLDNVARAGVVDLDQADTVAFVDACERGSHITSAQRTNLLANGTAAEAA